MKAFERKQLLERLDREGATIGTRIPEQVTVQGEEVPLRDFVFEVKRRESVPPSDRERVDRAKKNLRRERLQRRQRIEREDDLSYEEGEALVESILGISRALHALEQLEPTDLEEAAAQQETADQQRWMSFLKKVLGHDSDGGRLRP